MGEIKSDLEKTQQAYFMINSAISKCSNVTAPEKDESTTVKGNKHAHDAIDKILSTNQSITTSLNKVNTALKDVGDSFNTMDMMIGNEIAQ